MIENRILICLLILFSALNLFIDNSGVRILLSITILFATVAMLAASISGIKRCQLKYYWRVVLAAALGLVSLAARRFLL